MKLLTSISLLTFPEIIDIWPISPNKLKLCIDDGFLEKTFILYPFFWGLFEIRGGWESFEGNGGPRLPKVRFWSPFGSRLG